MRIPRSVPGSVLQGPLLKAVCAALTAMSTSLAEAACTVAISDSELRERTRSARQNGYGATLALGLDHVLGIDGRNR